MSQPGPHPGPPPDLYHRKLQTRELQVVLYRSYRLDSPEPLYFGKTGANRFDDPLAKYGVMYAGLDISCAFVETFEPGLRPCSTAELRDRGWAVIAMGKPLRVVDLTPPGSLAAIGADSRLFAGDYEASQAWSRAFYEHPRVTLDGLLYPARHDPTRSAVALFDHAKGLHLVECHRWYDAEMPEAHRLQLAQILDLYEVPLIETISRPDRKPPEIEDEDPQGSLF